jgi:multiple sugar transport system substrate-binding protein
VDGVLTIPKSRIRIAVRKFDDFENALAEEINIYTRSKPSCEVEAVPFDVESLHVELFSNGGLMDGSWDLGFIVTDWLAEAAASRALEDLTPYMQHQPIPDWPDGWASSLVAPLYFGSSVYSLPWHDGPECLIYRRDLFESKSEKDNFLRQYSYSLAPPRTWHEFRDVARFFTRPEAGLYGTLFAAFPDGHNTLYDFALQVWSRGGELTDNQGNITLDTPEAQTALDYYRNLILDHSVCHPEARKCDSTRAGDVFLSGSVAMMVNWFGFSARCERLGSCLKGRVAIAPIPVDESCDRVSLSVFWTIGIGIGSREKKAAYDFLRFIAGTEQDRGIVRHGAVGARLSTWRDREVQAEIPAYQRLEELSLGARQLPRSRNLPAFAEIINEVMTEALEREDPSSSILIRAQQNASKRGITLQ